MKYYQLLIDTENNSEIYNSVTKLLGLTPTEDDKTEKNLYDTWMYMVTQTDDTPFFDFINVFLDMLEPKFTDLGKLGITKDKILFWMLYEYEHQCAMEFHPQEMARLGQSGINLNIDCWANIDDKNLTE